MLATPAKAAAVAKDFKLLHGRALKFTTGGIRSALVCELILSIVTAQEEGQAISSNDVYKLRMMVEDKLKATFGNSFFE